jgi:hypothetical protein
MELGATLRDFADAERYMVGLEHPGVLRDSALGGVLDAVGQYHGRLYVCWLMTCVAKKMVGKVGRRVWCECMVCACVVCACLPPAAA